VRLSLSEGKQSDHADIELDWKAEEVATERKAPLEGMRACLQLSCRFRRNSGGVSADPASKWHEWFRSFGLLLLQIGVAALEGSVISVFCYYGNGQVSQGLW
jgi:hypothetical protein